MSEWTQIWDKEDVVVKLPVNQKEPFEIPSMLKKYEYGPVRYKIFKRNILSEHGVIISGLKSVKENFYNDYLFERFRGIRYKLHCLLKKKTISKCDDSFLIAFDIWSSINLFHFYFFTLEKIILMRKVHELKNFKILVPNNVEPFVFEAFRILKIDNYFHLTDSSNLKSDFAMVTAGNNTILPSPKLTKELRTIFLNNIKCNITAGSKIYVSRQKATKRKIINSDELDETLEKYGIVTIYAENLTLEEQISIFSNAQLVISPHGAGLSNIIFMKSKTIVIEINNADHKQSVPHYMVIAHCCSLDYYYFDAEMINGDFEVNTARLNRLLSEISIIK
jgi:hypothetical protein